MLCSTQKQAEKDDVITDSSTTPLCVGAHPFLTPAEKLNPSPYVLLCVQNFTHLNRDPCGASPELRSVGLFGVAAFAGTNPLCGFCWEKPAWHCSIKYNGHTDVNVYATRVK